MPQGVPIKQLNVALTESLRSSHADGETVARGAVPAAVRRTVAVRVAGGRGRGAGGLGRTTSTVAVYFETGN